MQLKFQNLSHTYYGVNKKDINEAIKDINLKIESKDAFVAIVGRTGSGKSTLILHSNALLLPTSGTVDVMGSIITPKKRKNPRLRSIRQKVGFVFQFPEYQLFEETVLDDIRFAPLNFGSSKEEATSKALKAAEIIGLDSETLSKSPFHLSGGQMRKAAIAGILSYDPEILVLDEPTRGLDPSSSKEIMNLFAKINQEMHKTIIMVTHDMNLVYEYASRVVVLDHKEIVYDGDKETLFKSSNYLSFGLGKPDVLKAIDYLNQELGLNIGYDNHNIEELFTSLKKEVEHE